MFDIVMKKVFLAKMNQYSITIRRLFVVVVVVQITSKTIFTNRLHYFEKKIVIKIVLWLEKVSQ